MRLSARVGDPGYDAWNLMTVAQRKATKILLDGQVVEDVETADDEEGLVVLLKLQGPECQRDVRHGKVEIKLEGN